MVVVNNYVRSHGDLVPAPRVLAVENASRGLRYESGADEMFQMDWGFVKVLDDVGNEWQCTCFAMVCHHCGLRYVEFFKSARSLSIITCCPLTMYIRLRISLLSDIAETISVG